MLLPHVPAPGSTTTEQLDELVELGVLAERLGFDAYGIGERHDRPAVSSSPAVLLSHVAAHTSRIRLFTAITAIGLHDPVRQFEDYATLDHLARGRLDLIIGKGAYAATQRLFNATPDDQWDRLREHYELFRRLWREDRVTWTGTHRPPLQDAEGLPRPLQPAIRVWHGSSTSRLSTDLAARHGDPLFSSNGAGTIERYAELIRHYRERFEAHGHDPADALVGVGTAGYFGARTTREAIDRYRPVFEARLAVNRRYDGATIHFDSVEDWVERSSVLVGSPQQIIDKIHEQHRHFGHEIFHIHVDRAVLGRVDFTESLELFFAEIAPVIRRELPSRPLDRPAVAVP
ncbi:LLM class flavin-dependent oxidoreductase [Dactylosporangium cerinum]|uniref:LLM class flavin-dependent oxidoreductase n=1 Tax=Dactylosporangium cerinum TaxID=1434730 RepID=A0ABV9VTE7_9ACTN